MLLVHPLTQLNVLIPCFRKVVRGFNDNGPFELILHFYNGGLRTPRSLDAEDKLRIKEKLTTFLREIGESDYTGQIAFEIILGKFTDTFDMYPGRSSFDRKTKLGYRMKVEVDSWGDRVNGYYLERQ